MEVVFTDQEEKPLDAYGEIEANHIILHSQGGARGGQMSATPIMRRRFA